jgi:hypothetical protein
VWLAPLPRVRSDLNRAGLRVRWCTETSRAHRITVDALVAAYTSAAAALRATGAGPPIDGLVAPHRLWSRWLREGRVRKFAVVAEKVRHTGGGPVPGGGSGLRDLPAEGLQADGLGLAPTAAAGVQRVDRALLVGGELEVEDVDVLGDPGRGGRLRGWSVARGRANPGSGARPGMHEPAVGTMAHSSHCKTG